MAEQRAVGDVLEAISRTINEVEQALFSEIDENKRNTLYRAINNAIRNLERLGSEINDVQRETLSKCLADMSSILMQASPGTVDQHGTNSYQSERIRSGRPAVNITEGQLKMLQGKGFTVKQMAAIFKCSSSLINSRLNFHNLQQRQKYTVIDDASLDVAVDKLHKEHPSADIKMMTGYLKAEGIFLQRQRIRESLARVDATSAAQRWSNTIQRRTYKVASPNSVWHMDGHMKLIRLEDEGKLSLESEIDLQVLHAIYLPEINDKLAKFQAAWNSHPIRTERHMTPEQFWINGLLSNSSSTYSRRALENEGSLEVLLQNGLEHYGLTLHQFGDLDVVEEPRNVPEIQDILASDISSEEKYSQARAALRLLSQN